MAVNKKIFSKISLWWMDTDIFRKELSYSATGKSIAILKTIIALALVSDFDTREAKISYSDLEDITGLSRPMVNNALKWLIEKEWLKLNDNSHGRTNVYELIEIDGDLGWTKLPYQPLIKNLKIISNRGPKSLTALKNYLMILRYRPNKEDVMQINHTTLIEKGNLRPNLVKSGNDLLLNADLIGLGRCVTRSGQFNTSPNMYHVKGLYFGRKGVEQQSHVEEGALLNISRQERRMSTISREFTDDLAPF